MWINEYILLYIHTYQHSHMHTYKKESIEFKERKRRVTLLKYQKVSVGRKIRI